MTLKDDSEEIKLMNIPSKTVRCQASTSTVHARLGLALADRSLLVTQLVAPHRPPLPFAVPAPR